MYTSTEIIGKLMLTDITVPPLIAYTAAACIIRNSRYACSMFAWT
jgi:hypothetical protein